MSLRTGLLLALAYVLLLAVVALVVPLGRSVRDRVDAEIRSQARATAEVVAATSAGRGRAALRDLAGTAARNARGRVIVLDRAGRIVADSDGTGAEGARYATPERPELGAALAGRAAQDVRRSDTLGTDLLVTAVPRVEAGRTVGAVRITQDIAARNRAVRRSWTGLALVGLLVLGLGLTVGSVIANRIARPVGRLQRAAARVAAGDLDARAAVEGSAEQRALAREFNTMTERLGRLLRSQQEFVADASHQLRTPLAGLRLRIEEAQAETTEPAARVELGHALREVDRLAQMVGELLELSRAGERERPGERVSLARAVAAVHERWEGAAGERGQRLTLELEGDEEVVCAPADLDRALDVLVENALRYSEAGTTVALSAAGRAVSVRDEGPGLRAGEEDAVFERFHRGSAGRAGPSGTGLGLPIARELVRRWGGEVVLRNRDDGPRGAVAELTFPSPGAA